MSQENVEIVRGIYDGLAQSRSEEALKLLGSCVATVDVAESVGATEP